VRLVLQLIARTYLTLALMHMRSLTCASENSNAHGTAMVFLALIRSALAIAALLLFGASYSEAAEGEVAAYDWPTAGWRVSTPEDQGMDSAALADLVDFGASRGLNSLLVARHGMIVVEAFYAPFRSGLKHRTRSVTKSVTGHRHVGT
jgi:hypothetical protein